MERHPIISKNYLKGDKPAAEAAWKRLSKELNSVGPPVKEACEWKRVGAPKTQATKQSHKTSHPLINVSTGVEGLENMHSKEDCQ